MTREFLCYGRFPDTSGPLYQQCSIAVALRFPLKHHIVYLSLEIDYVIFHLSLNLCANICFINISTKFKTRKMSLPTKSFQAICRYPPIFTYLKCFLLENTKCFQPFLSENTKCLCARMPGNDIKTPDGRKLLLHVKIKILSLPCGRRDISEA